jgi:gamma-glutamyl-gamma-aminobutyrate hydrolase PuuD
MGGSDTPLVGIVADLQEHARAPDLPWYRCAEGFYDAVLAAGGWPCLLPVCRSRRERLRLLDRIDALILTGGADLDPRRYGGPTEYPEQTRLDPRREAHDLELIALAWERPELPLLAVCLGMQELNVVRGGDLHPHLPDVVPGAAEGHGCWWRVNPDHEIRLDPASRLARLLGVTHLTTDSNHHQAVHRPGRGLRAVGWTEDGVIEALEAPERGNLVAVQWHPERIHRHEPMPRLFRFLAGAA